MFDTHGGFWFTDHGKVDYEKRCHDVVSIFYAHADGSFIEEVIFPSYNPNGIGLSPDGTKLYAAETYTCRSEEPTSALQSLMRSSYTVFCLQQKSYTLTTTHT